MKDATIVPGPDREAIVLSELLENACHLEAVGGQLLPQSGSNRRYYRITTSEGSTCIGVYSENRRENTAFLEFSRSMRKIGLKVPEIIAVDLDKSVYLQEDLGDVSLYSFLQNEKSKNEGNFTERLEGIYRCVLDDLRELQEKAASAIDFSLCYPRQAFDRQSMDWDLQYFKYYFLRLAKIPFDEQLLEQDFERLTDYLLSVPLDKFLYRDFQSRNIMLRGDNLEPWYIDYQGGRRGAKHYDVASLLFDAKADIPVDVRERLARYFFGSEADREMPLFYGFVLIRIMQAMGAYGYRGFFERKSHFLQSIPYALRNIDFLLKGHMPPIELPHLTSLLKSLTESEELNNVAAIGRPRLRVQVSSFSFKHAIPTDLSGNGGGYVFDCRALPNPGRYEQYKGLTGMDAEVIRYFEDNWEPMQRFLDGVSILVGQSVETYKERNFTNLMVSFGCTGGQHRSVFCAEQIAHWLSETYDVDVTVKHWEQR
ncbi:MAG: phosphotransferase [Marinilabiliaceae bacterium]|nr:phosphotransferase [Marinilabiliaceae bacterium]